MLAGTLLYKYVSNSYQTKYCRYHINWGPTGGGGGVLCISLFAILGYPQFKLKLIDSHLFTLKSIATVELDVNFPYLRLPLCHGSTTVLPRQMSGKRLVKFNGKLLVAVVKKGEREPSVTTVRAVKF